MQVQVCDALCGAGKTSAAINMMNDRRKEKFIFITQYLTEAERIKDSCPTLNFKLPFSDLKEGKTKLGDIKHLISAGENIASTHSLFSAYTDEIKTLIKEQGYILILDEAIDIFTMSDISGNDIDILQKSDSICEEGGMVKWINDSYLTEDGGRFRDVMLRARAKNLIKYDESYFFWSIAPELFGCFKEAYLLTYMFDNQDIRCFFDLYNISYKLIGTHKANGRYEFCPIEKMDRKRDLRDKVHILEHTKLNSIGSGRTSLSATWYQKAGKDDTERLRKNLGNLFKNVWGVGMAKVMWTTFKDYREALSDKGYKSGFLSYNKRACNTYADRTHMAYCVNNFPRPWERRYFKEFGVTINGDMYALSILVQWLFRSAIRNGQEVWVYIPSVRMRTLLQMWLDNLAEGKDLEPITYISPKAPRKNYYIPKKKKSSKTEKKGK